jgi:hypothetical protein
MLAKTLLVHLEQAVAMAAPSSAICSNSFAESDNAGEVFRKVM